MKRNAAGFDIKGLNSLPDVQCTLYMPARSQENGRKLHRRKVIYVMDFKFTASVPKGQARIRVRSQQDMDLSLTVTRNQAIAAFIEVSEKELGEEELIKARST